MIYGVVDTHAVLWYLFDDPKLSPRAVDFIESAAANRTKIAVSAISLVEIVYLIDKRRLLPSSV